jgi:hypothetical protein
MSTVLHMRRREKLPHRRPSVSCTVVWRDQRLHVTIGFAPDGRVLEVFARSGRPASDVDALVDDAAVLASRLLQHGDRLADIARGLGRLPGGEPASLIGVIVDAALAMEREIGQ